MDAKKIKEKIVQVLKLKGPNLPVKIARETEISSLFAGAFLSELAKENMIRISNMKVGGSPLYYLKGQETSLEKFYQYLPGKEREAFLHIKENKILKDREQEPAIRVALRSIKDFAVPFKQDEEPMWYFHSLTEQEVRSLLEKSSQIKKPEKEIKIQEKEIKIAEKEIKKAEILVKPIREQKSEKEEKPTKVEIPEKIIERKTEKPLIEIKPIIKKQKSQEKSNKFLEEIKQFLFKKDIEFLEEIKTDKSEIMAKIRINSDLGKISFLLIAKNKKRVTEADIVKAYQKSIDKKMSGLLLFKGELSKKMQEFSKEYKDLIKIEKIE